MKRNIHIQHPFLLMVLIMLSPHAEAKEQPQCPAPSDIVFRPSVNPEYPFGYDLQFSWSGPEAVQYEWQLANGSPISGSTSATTVTVRSVEAGISVLFSVRTRCTDNTFSEWVTQRFVVPDVYCPDPTNVVITPAENSFSVSWIYPIKPYVGFEYIVERVEDGEVVAMDLTPTSHFTVGGLEADTEYKVTLNVWCDPSASGPGNVTVYTVRTKAANCISKGVSSTMHYIDLVQLNTIRRVSRDDNGYISTGLGTTLQTGEHYRLQVSAGAGEALRFVNVWIDYNMDGDFYDAHERVASRALKNSMDMMIVVPKLANEGATTMRVMIQPHPTKKFSNRNKPCGSYSLGETEDYRITIERGTFPEARSSDELLKSIAVFPNPVTDILYLKGIDGVKKIAITDELGNIAYEGSAKDQLNVSDWRPGIYYLKVIGNKNLSTIRFVKR